MTKVKYIFLGILGLLSCRSSNPSSTSNPLIGKWIMQSYNGISSETDEVYFVFYEDHTAIENTINGERTRTWKINENELCISSSPITICENYEINGDHLYLDFGRIHYKRK